MPGSISVKMKMSFLLLLSSSSKIFSAPNEFAKMNCLTASDYMDKPLNDKLCRICLEIGGRKE